MLENPEMVFKSVPVAEGAPIEAVDDTDTVPTEALDEEEDVEGGDDDEGADDGDDGEE